MSNEVQFEFDEQARTAAPARISKFAQFVIKYSGGLVKDEKIANYFLFIFSFIALCVTVYIYWGLLSGPKNEPLTAEQLKAMNVSFSN